MGLRKMKVSIGNLFLRTFQTWWMSDPFSKSAAVSYYSIFSLPGLMIIVLGVAAAFFDRASIENEVLSHIRNVMGYEAAANIDHIIDETQRKDRDLWAMIVGLVTLLAGATGIFVQLQKSLNELWEVKVKDGSSWLDFIRHRMMAFGIILAIGFLLTISLTVTALVSALSEWAVTKLPIYALYVIYFLNFVASYFIVSFLFALIFKVLPDIHLPWKTSLAGGVLSATLFVIGEYALNTYFKVVEPASAFSAAGSLILVMLWVYYSSLILLLGAHFTKAYTKLCGQRISPTSIAQKDKQYKDGSSHAHAFKS